MKSIALLYRKKVDGRNSIEGVFSPLDSLLNIHRIELPCDLNTIKSAFKLLWFALHIKEKNIHVTGDIHYMAIFLFWKKIIVTVHDCNHYEDLTGIRKKIMGFVWYSLPLRIANKITVISPYAMEQLCRYFNFNHSKIIIIPNSFHPIKKVDYKKKEDKFTILSVGSLRIKNRKRLIEAVKGLPDVELSIIGKLSDELTSLLKTYNISYKNYYFISRQELESYYNKADVLFFASLKEGFGLPILEAQSCGLPVITSNTTSMPYVAASGACIVDPYDVVAIRKAILKIKDNLEYRQDIVTNGFENIKRFKEANFTLAFKDLYKMVFNVNDL
ncbi:Glycosyltransferase involved in cell wall bisynthesis [Maribacter orientalis]|uniref:Glycosyltransferase involved in cell wall bisynthesis n=1 Tax=Maribacter orientalis TaxID=228957 RepID=A0A1H7N862_9FLAO|nr:glycosyltransferase family 1 protein [Maribacter orientalis]SEL19796.1 Glycosyltransferase involved in cell wall bisynthesis [Maribacter orientalis]